MSTQPTSQNRDGRCPYGCGYAYPIPECVRLHLIQHHNCTHAEAKEAYPDVVAERCYIGRYSDRETAERVSATYGDTHYPNRTVEPEEVGGRTDWLIWCDRVASL